jgi:hypothetical protein
MRQAEYSLGMENIYDPTETFWHGMVYIVGYVVGVSLVAFLVSRRVQFIIWLRSWLWRPPTRDQAMCRILLDRMKAIERDHPWYARSVDFRMRKKALERLCDRG